MQFLWDENNSSHIRGHGVSPERAEAVFWAGCHAIAPTQVRHRWLIEAEVEGQCFRLIFDRSQEDRIYPITCFRI